MRWFFSIFREFFFFDPLELFICTIPKWSCVWTSCIDDKHWNERQQCHLNEKCWRFTNLVSFLDECRSSEIFGIDWFRRLHCTISSTSNLSYEQHSEIIDFVVMNASSNIRKFQSTQAKVEWLEIESPTLDKSIKSTVDLGLVSVGG